MLRNVEWSLKCSEKLHKVQINPQSNKFSIEEEILSYHSKNSLRPRFESPPKNLSCIIEKSRIKPENVSFNLSWALSQLEIMGKAWKLHQQEPIIQRS